MVYSFIIEDQFYISKLGLVLVPGFVGLDYTKVKMDNGQEVYIEILPSVSKVFILKGISIPRHSKTVCPILDEIGDNNYIGHKFYLK